MELKPGYKQTEAGVMPEDWNDFTVEELKSSKENALSTGPFGSSIGSRFFRNSGVPIIRGGNLSGDSRIRLDDSGLAFLSKSKALEFARSVVRQGDLVFTCWGTINQIGLIDDQAKYAEYIISNKQMKLTPDLKRTSSLFLYYLFSSSIIQARLTQNSIGSSIPGFNLGQLRSMHLTVPPLPEQRAIAGALSDTDALLSSLDRLIAKKRDIKQAVMQQLLTGKQRLPGFSEEWKTKRLGDIASMGSGGTPPSKVAGYYGGNLPWVSVADMTSSGKYVSKTERNLTLQGLQNSSAQLFPTGTILYAMYASIGECSIATTEVSSSQAILGILVGETIIEDYLYFYLVSKKAQVKEMGQQGTQSNINKGMVENFEIFLPSLPEQTAIAAVLSDMDAEIDALQRRRDKTRAIKQ